MSKREDLIARFVEGIVSGSSNSMPDNGVTIEDLTERRAEIAREAVQALKQQKNAEIPLELARLTAAIRYLRHREAHGA